MPTKKNQELKADKPVKKTTRVKKTSNRKPTSSRSKKTVKVKNDNETQLIPTEAIVEANEATNSNIVANNNIARDLRYWKILAWFGVGALASLLVISIVATITKPDTTNKSNYLIVADRPAKKIDTTTQLSVAPLTGLPVETSILQRRAWAVVVENFPTVRPQFGLSQADIVFESPTEGGITRFLAIYQSQMPDKVGPIRSARSFFNDWARAYSPYYSHSGGSTKALNQLSQGYGNIFDVNEFYNGSAYSRDSGLDAPHNLFTSADKFLSYVKSKDKSGNTPTVPAMSFTDQPIGSSTVQKITIPYKPEEYEVTYKYNDGYYERQLIGQTQTDANTTSPLRISNVVILFTDVTPIPGDSLKRVDLRTLGQGKVMVFSNGQKYTGTWEKNNLDDAIKFLDDSDQLIPLKAGQTWISVIDKSYLKSVVAE